jgi:hypothetical protein
MNAESAKQDLKEDVAPWIERFARVGYVAKAILYATVGILAAGAALGNGQTTDTRGAMMKLVDAPFGRTLMIVTALGLFGYAAWRCISAVVDAERRGNDAKGVALRVSFFLRGIAHAVLGYSALRIALGSRSEGGDRGEQAATTAMTLPGGVMLLWAVAIGIGGFGLWQLYRAAKAKLSKQVKQGEARAEVGGWVIAVSRFGIAARGLVFLAIAWLLSRAAAEHDPSKAGGIDDALNSLSGLGWLPFAAISIGLIAYGVYELLNARYRRIEAA